jgi:hypothetical protein
MPRPAIYRFKGVTLLKGAVHLGENRDQEGFVTMEVETEKLVELISRNPGQSQFRTFTQLSISEKNALVTKARDSQERPLEMPTIMLGKKSPNCFFSAYELERGAVTGTVSKLDLLFPNNSNVFATCLTGEEIVGMFLELNATTISIQLPRNQEEVASNLFRKTCTTPLPRSSSNEEPQVLCMT